MVLSNFAESRCVDTFPFIETKICFQYMLLCRLNVAIVVVIVVIPIHIQIRQQSNTAQWKLSGADEKKWRSVRPDWAF